jgi:Domain of unknown function (DUF4145)
MRVVANYPDTTEHEDQGVTWTAGNVFELLKCPACGAMTLRSYYWHDGLMEPGDDVDYQVLYPSERAKPRGLPDGLASDYEAAQRVKHISPNAYGVLLGRVLELVCEDRQAHGDSLHKKLHDLSARGEIPAKLVDVAKSLKDLRNVGVHPSLGNLTSGEVPILEDLTRAILEYVYSAPALAEAAVLRLKALKNRKKPTPEQGA